MSKVAVVTGCARGLGKEIALTLSKEGYTMVVHYHKSEKEAEEVLTAVKKHSGDSIAVSGDLRDEKQVEKMFSEILTKLSRVDLLVNNVGNFVYKSFSRIGNEEFKDIIESNIYSTLFCSRAVLPFMRKVKGGHIINIGVVGAERLNLLEKSGVYFLAKTGVYTLTKLMAHEEAKHGIHINMVSPASLETDIFKKEDFPMGRSANYSDVVKVLLFLISPQAYYINGSNVEVAGAFIPGLS